MPPKIFLLSEFDGEVFCNNMPVFEINGKCQKPKIIKFEKNLNEINLKIIPFQRTEKFSYLTINGKILVNESLESDCANFELFKLKNNDWLLKIKASCVKSLPLFSKKINNSKIKVFSEHKTCLIIEHDNKNIEFLINTQTDMINSESYKHYEILKFFYAQQLKHIIIFNPIENNIIFNQPASLIEIEDNLIKIMSPLNDILHHAKVIELVLIDNINLSEDLKIKKEYLLFLTTPKKIILSQKIPFAFLECVNAKNYKFARSLCTKNLNEKMKDEHFELFFDKDFKIIYFQTETNLCFTIKEKNVNAFKFTFLNGKIDNIIKL